MENFCKYRSNRGYIYLLGIIFSLLFLPFPLKAFNDIQTAHVFDYEGVKYCVTSFDDNTVDVVNPNTRYFWDEDCIPYDSAPYSGDIVIKSEVVDGDDTYTVTGIRNRAFYGSNVTSLTLPKTIKKLGECAFSDCKKLEKVNLEDLSIEDLPKLVFSDCSSLTSIVIPLSVKEIGEYAFDGCNRLGSITIPSSVEEIGDNAFTSCSSLRNISLPSSINKISYGLLKNCRQLKSVEIPMSVEGIEGRAFSGCERLFEIKIPESVKSIDWEAFSGCSDLQDIKLPSGLTEISLECFSACASLEEIVLPSGIKRIGAEAFKGCCLLKDIEFPDALTEIEESAFDGATSLSHIFIPKGVTSIWPQAFGNCSYLKEITVDDDNEIYSSYNGSLYSKNYSNLIACPAGKESLEFHKDIKGIGYAACIGCSLLRSVDIPESIDHIGDFAFSGCTGLKTITLPFGFKRLCCDAFAGCERIETIYCKASTPPVFDEEKLSVHQLGSGRYKGTFTLITENNAKLYVPEESLSLYKEAYGWSYFNNINAMDFSGVNSVVTDGLEIYVSDGAIHVDGVDDSSAIEVYTLTGNKVYSGHERTVANLPSGIYIVKIGALTRKVII